MKACMQSWFIALLIASLPYLTSYSRYTVTSIFLTAFSWCMWMSRLSHKYVILLMISEYQAYTIVYVHISWWICFFFVIHLCELYISVDDKTTEIFVNPIFFSLNTKSGLYLVSKFFQTLNLTWTSYTNSPWLVLVAFQLEWLQSE